MKNKKVNSATGGKVDRFKMHYQRLHSKCVSVITNFILSFVILSDAMPLKTLVSSHSKIRTPIAAPNSINKSIDTTNHSYTTSILKFSYPLTHKGNNNPNNNVFSVSWNGKKSSPMSHTRGTRELRFRRVKRVKIVRIRRVIRPIYRYSSTSSLSSSSILSPMSSSISTPTSSPSISLSKRKSSQSLEGRFKKFSSTYSDINRKSYRDRKQKGLNNEKWIKTPIMIPDANDVQREKPETFLSSESISGPSLKEESNSMNASGREIYSQSMIQLGHEEQKEKYLNEEFPIVVKGLSAEQAHLDNSVTIRTSSELQSLLSNNQKDNTMLLNMSVILRNLSVNDELVGRIVSCMSDLTNGGIEEENWALYDAHRLTRELIHLEFFVGVPNWISKQLVDSVSDVDHLKTCLQLSRGTDIIPGRRPVVTDPSQIEGHVFRKDKSKGTDAKFEWRTAVIKIFIVFGGTVMWNKFVCIPYFKCSRSLNFKLQTVRRFKRTAKRQREDGHAVSITEKAGNVEQWILDPVV